MEFAIFRSWASGVIGSHERLKISWGKPREGSSPSSPTIPLRPVGLRWGFYPTLSSKEGEVGRRPQRSSLERSGMSPTHLVRAKWDVKQPRLGGVFLLLIEPRSIRPRRRRDDPGTRRASQRPAESKAKPADPQSQALLARESVELSVAKQAHSQHRQARVGTRTKEFLFSYG